MASENAQLAGFIAAFTPEIALLTKRILAGMRARLPGAVELVYDNYNALAIGFGPSEKTSEAIFSIAVYPRWVTLFFLEGVILQDPESILKGSGKQVRHVVLKSAADLDVPAIRELMEQALRMAEKRINAAASRRIVIKSISAKKRPRRPAQA
jgi:hypothetical protein